MRKSPANIILGRCDQHIGNGTPGHIFASPAPLEPGDGSRMGDVNERKVGFAGFATGNERETRVSTGRRPVRGRRGRSVDLGRLFVPDLDEAIVVADRGEKRAVGRKPDEKDRRSGNRLPQTRPGERRRFGRRRSILGGKKIAFSFLFLAKAC